MTPKLHATAAVFAVALACTEGGAPAVIYSLDADDSLDVELDHATSPWESLGIVRDPSGVPIRAIRVPDYDIPADGMATRSERLIRVRESLSGFRLWVVIAHELGHIVLDTPNHNPSGCGVMGGSDLVLCDEDIALVCERLPELEVCP